MAYGPFIHGHLDHVQDIIVFAGNSIITNVLLPKILNSSSCNCHKGHQLAEDEPVVNHLGVGGGGQSLHLADEDGGHHQHGGQVHTEGSLKEEGLEEGGGKGDQHQEEGGEVGGHHLRHDFPLQVNIHLDPFTLLRSICVDKLIVVDEEKVHVC